jgi:hypothetical protein
MLSNLFSRPLACNIFSMAEPADARAISMHQPERSNGEGMLPVPQSYLYSNQHQVKELADGAGPIFSTYSNMVEEVDINMAKRWQKDADGILVFVGTSVLFSIPPHPSNQYYRPVCSLPPFRYCLLLQPRTPGQAHRMLLRSIS